MHIEASPPATPISSQSTEIALKEMCYFSKGGYWVCPNCPVKKQTNARELKNTICSKDCPYFPQSMSSEGDRYPIETAVRGVTYELASLGVVHPCWSCEGHSDSHGNIRKLPQVVFYAEHSIIGKLIADHLMDLYFKKATYYSWIVSISLIVPTYETTAWSIHPGNLQNEMFSLPNLQRDLVVLGGGLEQAIRKKGFQLVRKHYIDTQKNSN